MSDKPEQGTEFETRTREVLEESTTRLDGRTLSRLTQARHAALDQLQRPVRQSWRTWIPAGAAAAVAVLAVMLWAPSGTEIGSSAEDEPEIIVDAEVADLIDDGEELEFYEWAAGELES